MRELLELFLVFMKVGACTFGGGYAMLPIIQRELVENRRWVTSDEITEYYAVGQCTPGLIAINTATFVGYKRRGLAGGIVASLGFIAVPLVLMCIIAGVLEQIVDLNIVKNAFAGIRVCVCVLVFEAVFKMWKGAVHDAATFLIFAAVLAGTVFFSISPILLVLAAGGAGAGLGIFYSKRQASPKQDDPRKEETP